MPAPAIQGTLFHPADQTGHEVPSLPYPWGPASRDTDTSVSAAEQIATAVQTLRDKALDAIRDSSDGLTADEVAARLHSSVLAIRPRVTELFRLGYIADSAARRFNASGRRAIVWKAVA